MKVEREPEEAGRDSSDRGSNTFMPMSRDRTSPAPRPSAPRPGGWTPHVIVAVLGLLASAALLIVCYVTDKSTIAGRLNDFYTEAWPSYHALINGHLLESLRVGPAYVGSLALRAPFALTPSLWGGSARAAYYASTVPCMIAMTAFCTWLAAQPRRRGGVGWASRVSAVVLAAFNPITLVAVLGGHPEEILGAVLCVGGIALVSRGDVGWGGLLIGLAVLNKTWALVAVPVAIVVMPADRRRGTAVIAAVAALLIPILVVRSGGIAAASAGAGVGTLFDPPQLLWWFGSHSWVVHAAREIILLAAATCAALWWVSGRARPRPRGVTDALLMLALVLLLRAALDPWNNLYYHLPFMFALMAYEVHMGRMPLMALGCSLVLFVVVPVHGILHVSEDARAAIYAAVVLPTIGWLAARLYLSEGLGERLLRAILPQRSRPESVATTSRSNARAAL